MRIAIVIERMDVSRGGREASTAQIAAALARRGHDVTVLCQSGSSDVPGAVVRPLGARGLCRVRRLKNFIAGATAAVRDGPFDVVHAMLPLPAAGIYQPRGGTIPAQAAAAVRRRGPWRSFLHSLTAGLNLCRRELGRMERRLVRDGRVLCLAGSEMVAEEFRNYYGRAAGVRVVFNAVDCPDPACPQRQQWRKEVRGELGLAENDVLFLTLATNFDLKGVPEAIEAFARWQRSVRDRPGAKLAAVGRGDTGRYRRLANRLGVGSEVVFGPFAAEPFLWYAAADVFVLLTWYDPCSRSVLEATRWFIPSITTVYNGAAEALAHGAGIVVASPRDIDSAAAAMDQMSQAQVRAVRAEACRQIADRMGIERHVDELLKVYESLPDRARAATAASRRPAGGGA